MEKETNEQAVVRTIGLCAETAEILTDFEDFLKVAKRVQKRVVDTEQYEDTQKEYLKEIVYSLAESIAKNVKMDADGRTVTV